MSHGAKIHPYVKMPTIFGKSKYTASPATRVFTELWHKTMGGRRNTFASRKSLATRLGMGEATAWRALKRLEEVGAIEIVVRSRGGRGHAHLWTIAKDIFNALANKMGLFAPQNCIRRDTDNPKGIKRTYNRPPKGGYRKPPEPPPPPNITATDAAAKFLRTRSLLKGRAEEPMT